MSNVVSAAGNSLISNGHIYQVGSGEIAVLGIIDATECPPTYGSSMCQISTIYSLHIIKHTKINSKLFNLIELCQQ